MKESMALTARNARGRNHGASDQAAALFVVIGAFYHFGIV
jgi:hypothetical protein